MRHVRRFGRIDDHFAIGAEAHAFRLDADRNLDHHLTLFDIYGGDHIVIFIGNVEQVCRAVENEQLRVRAGGQVARHFTRLGVDHLDRVIITEANEDGCAIAGQRDAARALAGLDGAHDGQRIKVNDADGIVFFIRNIGHVGAGRGAQGDNNGGGGDEAGKHEIFLGAAGAIHFSLHFVSGRSKPKVSSSDT